MNCFYFLFKLFQLRSYNMNFSFLLYNFLYINNKWLQSNEEYFIFNTNKYHLSTIYISIYIDLYSYIELNPKVIHERQENYGLSLLAPSHKSIET